MRTFVSQLSCFTRCLCKAAAFWPCRQCGMSVRLFEDYCPACGTYSPLNLPCELATRTAVLSLVAISLIRFNFLVSL